MKIDLDSPFMSFFARIFELAWLQILFVICSLPVFTMGASMAAMFTVCRKLQKNSITSVSAAFFEAFKSNFKKGTICWLILLPFIALLVFDILYYVQVGQEGTSVTLPLIVAYIVGLALYIEFLYIFPIMAFFDNTVKSYFQNAPMMAIVHFLTTLIVTAIYASCALVFFPLFPVAVFLGISGPCYIATFFFKRVFKKHGDFPEDEEETENA